jgi:hypothetical protein
LGAILMKYFNRCCFVFLALTIMLVNFNVVFAEKSAISSLKQAIEDRTIKVDAKSNIYIVSNSSTEKLQTLNPFQIEDKGKNDIYIAKLDSQKKVLYSIYLGGNGDDYGLGIEVDKEGNIYVVGMTTSTDFPVTNNAQQKSLGGVADAFVMKVNPKLKGKDSIIYATYIGGSQSDFGLGIKVNKDGAAYITGRTNSMDFPVTLSSVQPYSRGNGEAFLAKLNPDGSAFEFSTYLGGTGSDYAYSLDIDEAGNPCIAGSTDSPDLLVSFNAFQSRLAGKSDAFVTCLNQTGTRILYSTYFGGTGFDDAFEIKMLGKDRIQITGNTDGDLPGQNTEMFRGDSENNFKAEFKIENNNLTKNISEKRR